MVVDNVNTKLLCILDAMSYTAQGSFRDADGMELISVQGLKELGFHIKRRPTYHGCVEALRRRMREVTWILLWHSRLAGLTEA